MLVLAVDMYEALADYLRNSENWSRPIIGFLGSRYEVVLS
jgi:hypothetical protein